jgi:predicted RNA-binding protein with PIN domain
MTILIDGYNLLHVTGIVGQGIGPGTLQRSRNALLNYLAASLDKDERSMTTVVFDAHDPPPGRPREDQQLGICVKYAVGYADADTLLEELIQIDSAPRRMTVVSSDHRVQRAAKRRRATAVDSDVWFDDLGKRKTRKEPPAEDVSAKPTEKLTASEVKTWLEAFGDAPAGHSQRKECDSDTASNAAEIAIDNPFPPGYAEDLLEE